MVLHLDISLILRNSIYEGDGRMSRSALDLKGGCFLFRIGIWSGVDVGPGTLRGKTPPYSVLLMAGVGSGVLFHAPAVRSERKNTGGQLLLGDELPMRP